MWRMYDELIALVPDGLSVREFLAGQCWNLVRTDHVGMAMTPREGIGRTETAGQVQGMAARKAAEYLKSWNNHEAALALATINSVVNVREKVQSFEGGAVDGLAQGTVFEYMLDELRGKRVAVVGHFRGLDKMASQCELSILERVPGAGDLPDPACEYVLPGQDYVFITGTTLINKTLPRLLELSQGATVALVGPSTPMTPILFKYGIDILAGTAVSDTRRVWTLIQEGDQHRFFGEGAQMLKLAVPSGTRAKRGEGERAAPDLPGKPA